MEADVDVLIEDARWRALGLDGLAREAVAAALGRLGTTVPCEVSVLGADDARIAALNAQFRQKDGATNVLSWPATEVAEGAFPAPDLPGEPVFLGDIALAWETCAAEAARDDRPMAAHVTHLIVHGLLHLLGYDHQDAASAGRMEALEVEILAGLGVQSPY